MQEPRGKQTKPHEASNMCNSQICLYCVIRTGKHVRNETKANIASDEEETQVIRSIGFRRLCLLQPLY
jgi:hypothetical protein